MGGAKGEPGAQLGGSLQEWRRAAGLTQRELAARSGLSLAAVRDLEQGRSHRPRAGSLAALAGVLGLDAGQAAVLAAASGQGSGPAAGPAPGPGHGLWVGVLGPVVAWRDGVALAVGPPGRRAVLAVLALAAGELVRREMVIDVLWGQRPPATAAELVAAHVSRLRRVLDPAGASGVLRGDGAAGYRLRAGAGGLDVVVFGELARRAGEAAAAGDAVAACGLYEQALGLWRGEPAGDVAVLRGHPAVAGLLRRRAEVAAAYAQAACGLGWHERVIPLLEGLAQAEPLNERVHAALMVALGGTGQQAAAVAVFEGLRQRLDQELGVYPGPELAEAHQRVLRQDIPAPADGPAAAMRTLPRDVAAFTGREGELGRLIAAGAGAAGVVAIHAVDGMPGVGKTALVTRAAHLLAVGFPDGQLFVGLHAHTPGLRPADPSEVLAGLLACTGLGPREIPAGLDARAQRWRGRLAGKKVLLVLDDAAGHAQVEPLLPGTEGCLVLVTSRRRLVALPGAQPLALDTLPPDQAAELFTRLSGRAPDAAGAAAAADLARLCGYLPLAIALLAGRLAHHPGRTTTRFAAEFAAVRDRLADLAAGDHPGDPAVAAAFQMSYDDLPADPQRLFCLLGLHPGPDIDTWAAAALAGVPPERARQNLDALYTDHLIDEPAPGRYRFHDLIREYAHGLATRHYPAAARGQATGRLLDYYLHTAQIADRHLARYTRPSPPLPTLAPAAAPGLPGQAAAHAWLRAEHQNLLACIGYAAATAQPRRLIALTAAMASYLLREGPWQQAAALHQAAATTARNHHDRLGEASALHDLGRVRDLTGDYPAAACSQEQALAIYQDLGNRLGQANTLHALGRHRDLTGDYPAAAGLQERALDIYQDLGDRLGQANTLERLGYVRCMTGDYPAAADQLEQALDIYQDLGDRHGQANTLHALGYVRDLTGDYPAAAGLLERALAIYQDLGDRHGQANTLHALGRLRDLTGDYPAAAGLQEQALAIYQDLGNRLGQANTLHRLGYVRDLTGDYPAAAGLQEQALAIYQDLGSRHGEANALHALGRVRWLTGNYPAATDTLERSVALFREVGDAQGESEALNTTGALLAVTAGPREALAAYRQALLLARQAGSPLDEARALEGAARCAARTGALPAARDGLHQAIAIYQRIGAAEAGPAAEYLAAIEMDASDR